MEVTGWIHGPAVLTPGINHVPWTGGFVRPRAGAELLEEIKYLAPSEIWTPNHPASSPNIITELPRLQSSKLRTFSWMWRPTTEAGFSETSVNFHQTTQNYHPKRHKNTSILMKTCKAYYCCWNPEFCIRDTRQSSVPVNMGLEYNQLQWQCLCLIV